MNRFCRPCMLAGVLALVGAVFAAIPSGEATAAEEKQDPPQVNVFELSAKAALQRRLIATVMLLFREERYAEAEHLLRRLITRFPRSSVHHYNLAAALARQGKLAEALDSLAAAIDRGFASREVILKDPDLEAIRHDPRFQQLLARLDRESQETGRTGTIHISPYPIQDGQAVVGSSNTIWDSSRNLLLSYFEFGPEPEGDLVESGEGEVAAQLNDWFEAGQAAGNHGDLYDNRDRGHSRLLNSRLPQVSHIEYGEQAREAGFDYGINANILFNGITFGNSSTALTGGPAWRSQARLALTTRTLAESLYLQYLNDHLYVFPEHRDHDPEHGDLIPANTPYMIISQGSSGSDQAFLLAVGEILAAFRPDVKAFLRRHRLVMPTVQMILRSSLKSVEQKSDYLSARAHPSVFEAGDMARLRMIRRANGLTADSIPPRVTLDVVDESAARVGVDYFAPLNVTEHLFDTPGAVARIVRSTRYAKRMVVSAGKTKDPNGRNLSFHWVVLRGDADRIEILPLNEHGSTVEIRIPWHERRPVPYRPELSTDRVDIGVFVHNGRNYSAPAFISFLYPANQRRAYDGSGRIRQVIYDDAERAGRYVDPQLFPMREWRDEYAYTTDGRLTGWLRIRGEAEERFTRDGARVVETDSAGRPSRAERILYEVRRDKSSRRPMVVEVATGKFVTYRYSGPADRLGEIVQ